MKKIVVIGGGTMGLDIAQVFARNGYDVVVRDIKDEIIQASEARLNKGLDKLVSKGKLDEAKKMLGNTRYKIDEIAVRLGYSDASYFSKVFKKNEGMTPTQFRQSR